MKQFIEAIFDNGKFTPLNNSSLSFAQGQHVRLIVEDDLQSSDDLLELAAKVYEGLSDEQVSEIEDIALDRKDFFERKTAL
jgi:predicted DNA-binding antitoxin AbrB/MazE fold protein